MTKDQLLSWAVQNLKAWPQSWSEAMSAAKPVECSWNWTGHKAFLLNGVDTCTASLDEREWGAARAACGITDSDTKASAGEFQPFVSVEDAQPSPATTAAAHILQQGVDALSNRAAERDQADGERSMARCVKAFNVMFGHQITEEQGWQFMELLKMARAAGGAYREDDYVDGAAYAALAGEAAAKVRGAQ